jgi:phosphoglycolate phosphatase
MATPVVFDLDGTLIDSREDLALAANRLLADLHQPPLPLADIVAMVGDGAAVLVRRVLAARGLAPDTPDALPRFLAFYDACLLDHTVPYEGTLAMLEQLRRRCRLAVLTNKPAGPTARILDGLGLSPFFDLVVGGDSPLGRKPDPAGLLHIVRALGGEPETAVMVGDSSVDMETAVRAGTRLVLARFGFGYPTAAAAGLTPDVLLLDHPVDLPKMLEVMGG